MATKNEWGSEELSGQRCLRALGKERIKAREKTESGPGKG